MTGKINGPKSTGNGHLYKQSIELLPGTISRTLNNLSSAGLKMSPSALKRAVNSRKLVLNPLNLMPFEVALVNLSALLAINSVNPLDEYIEPMQKFKDKLADPRGKTALFNRFIKFCARQKNYGELTFQGLLKDLIR